MDEQQRQLVKLRAWLLQGLTPSEAAGKVGAELSTAQEQRAELVHREYIREKRGPGGRKIVDICPQYSVAAASWILGISERRLRAICLEGRLGES